MLKRDMYGVITWNLCYNMIYIALYSEIYQQTQLECSLVEKLVPMKPSATPPPQLINKKRGCLQSQTHWLPLLQSQAL